jgi:crotonobetainyl-CoA:carnitine CoA-transferase CaiB-like acyl-CoA transferase
VQSATGIACTEGSGDPSHMPGKLPCQALDHATGYLAAFAVMRALQRRAEEGGNWQIQVSLTQTGAYLTRLGVSEHITGRELSEAESAGWLQQEDSGFGQLTTLRPAEFMPACPPHTALPAMPAGSHPPVWW